MVLHGNRLEDLRDILVQWLKRAPLRPLEDERILVQSNGIAQWFPCRRTTIELGPRDEDFLQAYSALTGGVPDYPAVQAAATAVLATHCARTAGSVARESLWAMATVLRTTTMFGAFRIDPASGAQLGHQMALVRWTANGPTAVSQSAASTL